jgi:hypothetical protein
MTHVFMDYSRPQPGMSHAVKMSKPLGTDSQCNPMRGAEGHEEVVARLFLILPFSDS